MYLSKTFTPKATPEENLERSEYWLSKACEYEKAGKSAAILRMTMNKALDYETAFTEAKLRAS